MWELGSVLSCEVQTPPGPEHWEFMDHRLVFSRTGAPGVLDKEEKRLGNRRLTPYFTSFTITPWVAQRANGKAVF